MLFNVISSKLESLFGTWLEQGPVWVSINLGGFKWSASLANLVAQDQSTNHFIEINPKIQIETAPSKDIYF